jgi:hypothetical protein
MFIQYDGLKDCSDAEDMKATMLKYCTSVVEDQARSS